MKYVFILGSNYKDCKAKSESIIGEKDTKYAFVTKTKHLQGIPAEKMLEADNARANPEYAKIKRLFNKELKMRKAPTVPNFRKAVDAAIEHLQPKSIPEEFKEELDALIEKDEDVKEEIDLSIFVSPGVPVAEKDSVEEEPENMGATEDGTPIHPDSFPELKPEPEVDELPPEEPTVDEPVVVEETPTPLIDEIPEEEPVEELSVEDLKAAEPVEDEFDDELDIDVLGEQPEPDAEEEIKPVNPPRGWHLRNEFIDEVGNVFHKGEYVGKYDE